MNKRNLIVVLFTAIFILSGCATKPIAPRELSFAPAEAGAVKIMSFNIKANNIMDFGAWSFRKTMVFDVIADHAPDVLGLQEPLQGQLEQVQQAFPQYAYYSAGGRDGKTKGQTCPIFFRKDRFDLIDSGTFWFSNRPDTPGSQGWGEPVPRFASWVQLAEKGQDTSFYIYNTHLACLSQNSRAKSVRLLAKQIAARKTADPYIIMGDFNMKLTNPAMAFLEQIGLIDAWRLVHPDKPDVSTCNFGTWAKGPQLDHIQFDSQTKAVEVTIDDRKIKGRYPSDHFPVIAKIILAESLSPVVASIKP
jgi:endonuclease/exonuclease/phosphatase family metal-dependent hydrolase